MSNHKHQCGRITIYEHGQTILLEDGYGCQHIWEHQEAPGETLAEKVARHKCPNCGRGPWYARYEEPRTTRTLVAVMAALLLQACAVAPTPDTCFANYDHVSHPLLGPPFGPEIEEGTIDSIGTTCRWERGRVFFESGLSYMVPDSDLYGDDLLFNSRIAIKIWEK